MPTHRITLDPSWRITDTVCGFAFVDGVAEVDQLDDQALSRLSEMRPQVEAIGGSEPGPVPVPVPKSKSKSSGKVQDNPTTDDLA